MGKPAAFSPTSLYQTPMVDLVTGMVTWSWVQNFQQAAKQLNAPVSTAAPANSTDPAPAFNTNGSPIASDGEYIYVATGPNKWRRVALSDF